MSDRQLSLLEARAFLLDLARRRGVQLEVYGERRASTNVMAFDGQVSEFKLSTRQGVALRVLVGGAWGQSFSENLSVPALERALETATENAGLVAPEQGTGLHHWPPPLGPNLYGEGLSNVTVDQKLRVALELERSAREADPRVTSVPYAEYQDAEGSFTVANTAGTEQEARHLYAMQFVSPLVSEGGQNKMVEDWQFTREFTRLDPTRTARAAVEQSLEQLGARPAPTGTFPAVITGKALAALLSVYASMFSGQAVEEGRSPLAGRLGEPVASSLITLLDDATSPTGLNTRAFDAEGCPSASLTLIGAGRLGAFLHNAATAARAGTTSTGHATRHSLQSAVGVGPSNLIVSPGQSSPEEVRRGLTGLLLTGLSGLHAGANPVTGEFSLEAEGFWLEAGATTYPLEVFTVAGNMLDLLQQVEAVGQHLHETYYAVTAPDIRVTALAVAGS